MPEEKDTAPEEPRRSDVRLRLAIVTLVIVAFVGIAVAKTATPAAPSVCSTPIKKIAAPAAGEAQAQPQDALSAYDAALKAGKPIYVMFHSTTCAPCIEIAGVAEQVLPDYADKITFVDAVTSDDPSVQQLASKFEFQYIPSSFFLKADGTKVDSFTGAMDAAQMRGYLDDLVATE